MGLFDSLASKAIGSVLGGQQGGAAGGADISGLIGSVLSGKVDAAGAVGGVINGLGGLGGLQEKFQQSGLGEHFASWVGTGENKEITPEQLGTALGDHSAVADAAKAVGVDVSSLLPLLSSLLPSIISQLTPHGQVDPHTSQGAGLQQALSGLLSGGNLTNLVTSAMGQSGGVAGMLGGLLGGANKA